MKKLFTLFVLTILISNLHAQIGTATVSPTTICTGITVTLTATGSYTVVVGPQWKYSVDGTSWANLNPTQTTTVAITGVGLSTGYYRYQPNSGLPANSTQTVYLTEIGRAHV